MGTTETITIGKQKIEAKLCELNQADLKFYPENPRVYNVLKFEGSDPTQEEIERYMCSQDHVKQLKVSIESNGGLIDPLMVQDGTMVVLEGNSRLAAYRLLCAKDPIKWGKVKCKLLPQDISEATIFALLGQFHIVGRKDWDPFEQAHYLYRRHKQTQIPIEAMAQELGITKQKAEKMIQVIEFMIENNDLNKRHWSYYEEYLKNASIKRYRAINPDLDERIAEGIKSDLIREAADMRKLGQIAQLSDKQSKKIMKKIVDGEIDLYEGYNEVLLAGKLEDALKKLKRFREAILEPSFEAQVCQQETTQQALFEIKKIIKRLEALQQKLS